MKVPTWRIRKPESKSQLHLGKSFNLPQLPHLQNGNCFTCFENDKVTYKYMKALALPGAMQEKRKWLSGFYGSCGPKQCDKDRNVGGQVSRTLTAMLESLLPTQTKAFHLIIRILIFYLRAFLEVSHSILYWIRWFFSNFPSRILW